MGKITNRFLFSINKGSSFSHSLNWLIGEEKEVWSSNERLCSNFEEVTFIVPVTCHWKKRALSVK
jgi:hypothetical protein